MVYVTDESAKIYTFEAFLNLRPSNVFFKKTANWLNARHLLVYKGAYPVRVFIGFLKKWGFFLQLAQLMETWVASSVLMTGTFFHLTINNGDASVKSKYAYGKARILAADVYRHFLHRPIWVVHTPVFTHDIWDAANCGGFKATAFFQDLTNDEEQQKCAVRWLLQEKPVYTDKFLYKHCLDRRSACNPSTRVGKFCLSAASRKFFNGTIKQRIRMFRLSIDQDVFWI